MRNTEINKQLLSFTPMSQQVHADNVRAGWWSDLKTGDSIVETRNRGELMMLMVSELAEAADGYSAQAMDDKLPHRQMIEVELADAKIRILDAAGADCLNPTAASLELLGNLAVPQLLLSETVLHPNVHGNLMQIVCQISRAMESHRKKMAPDQVLPHRSGYEVGLACALLLIHELGYELNLDVDGAVAEKRAFNAQRDDHKVENRRAAGGKQY